jgi:hypothetical protein
MLTTLGIIIAVLIIGVLIIAAIKPDTFRVERTASIKAAPEKTFALINDFNAWGAWSPWDKKDPAMKRNLSAVTVGKGAQYSWEGNKEVGMGSMEITDSVPTSMIAIKLDFLKPFEAHNMVEFTLAAQGGVTNVTWLMHGPANFMSKLMQVFMNMDKMCGKDFEAGLANLKAAAEK